MQSEPLTSPQTRSRSPNQDPLHLLFLAAYPDVAAACRAVDRPGIVVIVVDERTGVIAGVRAALATDSVTTIVIGRHHNCDLTLAGDGAALRQLAIVLHPLVRDEPVTYRMIDLRTRDGFIDETGRALRAVRTDGPTIASCAGYALFVLPLGNPTAWPDRAELAWALLPRRVHLEERGLTPPPRHLLTSVIYRIRAPRDSSEELVREDQVGTLELMEDRANARLGVGARALHDGILFGRYSRCDMLHVEDPTLSRVHALLVQVGARRVVIDLASTFGTGLVGGPARRICDLGHDTELWLGHSTLLRWRQGAA